MASSRDPKTTSAIDTVEETLIAVILGLMTVITFANVIARYAFNSNILWALEVTVYLFAWLVLLGAGYCTKKTLHLGVDALVNLFSRPVQRLFGLAAVSVCIVFSFLMLKGCWDYWANFANLPATTGRWFPTGFEEMKSTNYRAWYEVNDTPMPEFLQFLADSMNEGERYEKMPRFIPYIILPISMLLLLLRFVQVAVRIWQGGHPTVIAGHEAEDLVEEAAAKQRAEEN